MGVRQELCRGGPAPQGDAASCGSFRGASSARGIRHPARSVDPPLTQWISVQRSRTMAIHRPSLFSDSDVLTFRQTPASEYRIPYTFVESLNEGTLFDRSARTFEE